MKPIARYALGLAVAALGGHLVTIVVAPRAIMHIALKRMSNDWQRVNQFQFGERTTQNSRRVVRPSPDLAYSSCVYDLSHGPIRVEAAPSPGKGYVSISVFDARTDNIAVFDTSHFPEGISFVLAREGEPAVPGARMVYARYDRGVILDRRLAPNAELFVQVDRARRADRCSPIAEKG